jgi:hypothetical protein
MMECKFNEALTELRNSNTVHNRKYFDKTNKTWQEYLKLHKHNPRSFEYLCMLHILGNIHF